MRSPPVRRCEKSTDSPSTSMRSTSVCGTPQDSIRSLTEGESSKLRTTRPSGDATKSRSSAEKRISTVRLPTVSPRLEAETLTERRVLGLVEALPAEVLDALFERHVTAQ